MPVDAPPAGVGGGVEVEVGVEVVPVGAGGAVVAPVDRGGGAVTGVEPAGVAGGVVPVPVDDVPPGGGVALEGVVAPGGVPVGAPPDPVGVPEPVGPLGVLEPVGTVGVLEPVGSAGLAVASVASVTCVALPVSVVTTAWLPDRPALARAGAASVGVFVAGAVEVVVRSPEGDRGPA